MTAPVSTERLSTLARSLRSSAILRIAGDVRALVASGRAITDLTVGDFSARQFRIPAALEQGIIDALRAGESTYPPPIGMPALRTAITEFYRQRTKIDVQLENVLVASGARPVIYALYRALVDPSETVVFGVPSWNNDYYSEILQANAITIECDATTDFLPTAELLRPHVRNARLVALNSPLNPTGTAFDADVLAGICDLVLEENARRKSAGERPLYVMYDQVYWMITARDVTHVDPISLRPEMAQYTVIVDAISKCFAATGLRVGWGIAPPDVIRAMNDIVGHIGAWAPRPEQVATARFLADRAAVDEYMEGMRRDAQRRLDAVYDGLTALGAQGLPVECVRPQGAIYVSARFGLHGMRDANGAVIQTDEDIRRYLLDAAGLAVVPFSAFGSSGDHGWFRLSIGVVSVDDIQALMPRVHRALEALATAETAAD